MTNFPIVDFKIIQNCIPQRNPIVMVDALLDHKNEYVQAALTIKSTNIFVQKNKLTEGGIIEHMAQSVALYTGYKCFINQEPAPVGYIGSIKKVEIFDLPEVDQKISTQVYVLHDIMGVTLVDTICSCNEKVIAKSQMKTVLAK